VSVSPKLKNLNLAENEFTWFSLNSCSLERLNLNSNPRLRIEDFSQLKLPQLKKLTLPESYAYIDFTVLTSYYCRL
jgi:hypothetical protein